MENNPVFSVWTSFKIVLHFLLLSGQRPQGAWGSERSPTSRLLCSHFQHCGLDSDVFNALYLLCGAHCWGCTKMKLRILQSRLTSFHIVWRWFDLHHVLVVVLLLLWCQNKTVKVCLCQILLWKILCLHNTHCLYVINMPLKPAHHMTDNSLEWEEIMFCKQQVNK